MSLHEFCRLDQAPLPANLWEGQGGGVPQGGLPAIAHQGIIRPRPRPRLPLRNKVSGRLNMASLGL